MSTLDIQTQIKLRNCILRGVSALVSITCILAICTAYIDGVKTWAKTREFLYAFIAFSGLVLLCTFIILIMSFRKDVTNSKFRYVYALIVYIFTNMAIIYASAVAINKHMVPVSVGISVLILLLMAFVGMKAKNLSVWGAPLYCALSGFLISEIVLIILMYTSAIPFNVLTIGYNITSGALILIFTLYIAYDVNMFVKNCDLGFRKCCELGTFSIWEDFTQILLRLIQLIDDK